MNYFLVGMPGCGKSSLGKELAKELNLTYVDLDKNIQKSEGRKITEIFEEEGEEYFRLKEQESLHQSIKSDNQIISTGGGAPCFFDNMDVIKSHGISIYLNVPVEAIAKRMMQKAKRLSKRPLIKSTSFDDLVAELRTKLENRDQYYSRADVLLKGEGLTVTELIEAIGKVKK